MSDEAHLKPSEIQLRDPLSEVTRKERRMLLGISALGIVIVKSGLVPAKVSALGIEFTQTNQQALIFALGAVVAYFFAAFVIYAASDLVTWKAAYQTSVKDFLRYVREHAQASSPVPMHYFFGAEHRWHFFALPISILRASFEFGVPIIIGIYAMVVLFTATPPPPQASG